MTYEEFRVDTLKANQKKHHFKVNNSYGIKDAYRWCIKHKQIDKSLSEKDFRIIINTINKSLQDQLLQGKDINLPERMGRIEIRKYPTYVGLEGDKIKTNLSVDWDKTLRLWFEDKEAYKNRTLVRCETKEKFKFIYNRRKAKYNNKSFYEFTPTRDLKLKLKEVINNQGFDALLLVDKNGLCKYKCSSR
jgi:nucleoid DNA-binding protein